MIGALTAAAGSPLSGITDPVVQLILTGLMLLIGGGTGGAIGYFRRDKRLGRVDDAAILEEVRKIAREEVKDVSGQLRAERRRTGRLEQRVGQLTEAMQEAGITVPPWPPSLRVVEDDDVAEA